MDKSEAVKSTRNGAIAATVSGVLTILVTVIAISSDATGRLAYWNDSAIFFDVVLIFLCAIGMYRKSRCAAIISFIYFLISKIIIAMETQRYGGFGLGFVFLYFYGKAIYGAFVYHRLEKAENPEYKPVKKWAYILGIPPALIGLFIVGYIVMSLVGVVPSTRVLFDSEVSSSNLSKLIANDVISGVDKVHCFYSPGVISILEEGNILTDDRVIVYLTDENDELLVYEIPLNEITEVVLETKGNSFDDSVYKVQTADPDRWLMLSLSNESDGDLQFVEALRKRMN